jgi:DUF4097 and DUF4098 domain-containing protein YvlB
MRWIGVAPLLIVPTVAIQIGDAARAQAQKQTFTFSADTTFAMGDSPELEIENQSGDVTVVRGEEHKVKVTARRLIPAADSAFAETFLKEARVDYDLHGNRLRIKASVGRSARERMFAGGLFGLHEQERGKINLEIQVPETSNLEVFTASGDQTIRGIDGTVRTQSASGRQDLNNLRGRLHAASASGGVAVSDCDVNVNVEVSSGGITIKNLTGDGSLQSTSGDITVRRARGDLSLRASSGDLLVDELNGSLTTRSTSGRVITHNHRGSVEAHTGSGDVELEAPAGPGESAIVRTGSGDIKLVWPPEKSGTLEISAGSGVVNDQLGVSWETRSRRLYRGRVGQGDAVVRVRIETGSGDVWIRGLP